ncbi:MULTISPECIES: DUF881 domain-containing protein [unclassified Isoptericola]|uniref:DUF881 domain-containing protein n=1 Tax=unclassified Isoptericola TaxID=2623355 RepID=UPI002713F824|nr:MULTISPECIES: DUF881 domain-containing protein [unclassified Isoptericola]MDO8144795.1 DUF881 domain-containing protein [Isoptericola sp. 178]MDO8149575.1 DUF881 domain-containing protein [Isoptericola sp. b515]MDO8152509.1 DUF881 domain-containing protein [Isoptericola sp. b408]
MNDDERTDSPDRTPGEDDTAPLTPPDAAAEPPAPGGGDVEPTPVAEHPDEPVGETAPLEEATPLGEGLDEPTPLEEPAHPDLPTDASGESASGHGARVAADPLDLSVPVEQLDTGDEPVPGHGAAAAEDPAPGTGETDDGAHRTPEPVHTGPFPPTGAQALPSRADDEPAGSAPKGTGAHEPPPATGWRALGQMLRPRGTRSQLLVALLLAALGFALVVQVQQSAQDPLSSARQDDLVRLLDEVTQRSEQLGDEVRELTETRDELASGSGQAQAALELAEERATSEGILSGRLPAVGPGLEIVISDPDRVLAASKMFNMLEELRNAGAEVIAVNDVRLVTSTWFLDGASGIIVDDQLIEPPYRWQVIGDPATLTPALEIPGGALAAVRNDGADARTEERDEVLIDAVRVPSEPEYATPRRPAE